MKMMSNHVGMNEVVETAVTMFEKTEINVNACKKIINACRDSSCRCDGNKYETIEYLYEDHWENCLKKKEDQVALGRWEIPGEIREAIVALQICKECYNKLSQKYDMEKAIVPDDEKYFWCCGKFYIFLLRYFI